MFQTCFGDVSEMFRTCFGHVSGIFRGCFGDVSDMFWIVSDKFRGELGMTEGLFLHRCSEYRFTLFVKRNFGAQNIAAQFSLDNNFGAMDITGGFSTCFLG